MGSRVGGSVGCVCAGCAVVDVTVGLNESADKMVGTRVCNADDEPKGSLQRHFHSVLLHVAKPPELK